MEQLYREAAFLRSEANADRSREKVTVASGNQLYAGAICKTSSGKKVPYDGTGTADSVLLTHANAADGDVEVTAIVRDAEVIDEMLYNKNSGYAADLRNRGIVLR